MTNEFKHKIEKDKINFLLDEKIYNLNCIMKAAYNFVDGFYILFSYESESKINVTFKCKKSTKSEMLESAIGEFHNELLNQVLRYNVYLETKNVRELLLGRALYSTCIEYEEEDNELANNLKDKDIEENIDYDSEDILLNWFDSRNNEEQ